MFQLLPSLYSLHICRRLHFLSALQSTVSNSCFPRSNIFQSISRSQTTIQSLNMSRNLARLLPQITNMLDTPFRRAVTPFNRYRWPASSLGFFDREFERMSNMMDRMHNDLWHSSSLLENPQGSQRGKMNQDLFNIVEENGKKKMRIIFEAERCKPEDIEIKAKGNHLEIKARTEEKGEHFQSIQEYSQYLTLPEGVKAEELTCQFEGGMVTLEAPYTPPAIEAPKDIPVQKEPAEPPVKHNIPIKHE